MALVVGIEPTSSRLELEMLPLHQTNMEEDVGFEPTEPCGPSAFKAGAISRTLPIFHLNRITLLPSGNFTKGLRPQLSTCIYNTLKPDPDVSSVVNTIYLMSVCVGQRRSACLFSPLSNRVRV